jgi:hypothetical protein
VAITILAQERKFIHMVLNETFIKNVANSCSCEWFVKETYKWGYDYITRFSKQGIEELTTWGSKAWISCHANSKGKVQIPTCAIASRKIRGSSC